MKKLIALMLAFTVSVAGLAQQHDHNHSHSPQQPQPPKAQAAPAAPTKPGKLTARARLLSFFTRGEGTLVVRGRGYLVINTVRGNLQIEGFREVKELPRNVRIKPPLDQRLKVYMGQGTVRIQGKYDSLRAVLRDASVEFNGIGAFELSGDGEAIADGVKRNLAPVSTFSLLVPEPKWQREDTIQPKTPEKGR